MQARSDLAGQATGAAVPTPIRPTSPAERPRNRGESPGWQPKKLLQWHREKAGSIEALHDVLKNELAAGVMPCGRFGANAAWLRFAVLTHHVLTALKRIALSDTWLRARPNRLRFQIFVSPGKLVHHARQAWLRVARTAAAAGGVGSGPATVDCHRIERSYGRIIGQFSEKLSALPVSLRTSIWASVPFAAGL